ncbi:MAG: DUF58 domain-containing protein [Trueperaceae bacterium]|nr:MAG: DUF58 domain-containing protein [Trueperaceae bacterium]
MISPRSRALLDRYALASKALSRSSGERLATEAGQSVEFHDFRPYQPGDELRYVDWRVYARTNRLYTRLYQAERTIDLHLVLDTSSSMQLGGKLRYARIVAELLSYVAQRDNRSQIHLLNGQHSNPSQGKVGIGEAWQFIDDAPVLEGEVLPPFLSLKELVLGMPLHQGASLVLIISDLFDEGPLQPALAALRARGFDGGFLQVMAEEDLHPQEGQFELVDVESRERLYVGPEEVRSYRRAVQTFLRHTRAAILQAGFRHSLLIARRESADELERGAFASLIREGILVKR